MYSGIPFAKSSINQPQDTIVRCGFCVSCHPINRTTDQPNMYRRRQYTRLLQAASGVGKALMPRIIAYSATSRVERGAPCYRERPLGLRLPSKRASPFFGGYPSSNRTCSFPAYGSPCGTGFISFASLRPSAPFHIDSDGCSSIWTSGFRRAAT